MSRKAVAFFAVGCAYVLFFGATLMQASTACDTHYLFASGQNAMNLCISNDGNLVGFESPAGSEHIRVGSIGEGYAVCSGPSQVFGYDAGFDEAGWGPTTVTPPRAGQTFPIVYTRTSLDGSVRLQQTFAINANEAKQSPEKEVTIAMKVTNLSSATINDVYITRYADFDVDGTSDDDIFSRSHDSVMANQGVEQSPGIWSDAPGGHAISLTAINFAILRNTEINAASDWATNHNVCATGASVAGPTNSPAGDYVGRVVTRVGNIAPGASKTVNFVYRRF